MTKGNANRLFIGLVFLSLFSAIADPGMECLDNMSPLSEAGHVLCGIFAYAYLFLRNSNGAVLLVSSAARGPVHPLY